MAVKMELEVDPVDAVRRLSSVSIFVSPAAAAQADDAVSDGDSAEDDDDDDDDDEDDDEEGVEDVIRRRRRRRYVDEGPLTGPLLSRFGRCLSRMGRDYWRRFKSWLLEIEMGVVWGVAGLAIICFVFAAIWFIDPAMLTLVLQFREARCTTSASAYLIGISNCSWTSCRHGCTREIYKCWQIEVKFDFIEGTSPHQPPWAPLTNWNDDDWDQGGELAAEVVSNSARLYPNVRGCGYPPDLNCDEFFETYKEKGESFDCWVSTMDTGIAMTELNLERAKQEVLLSLIPLFVFILFVLYAFCRLGIFTICNPLKLCPRAADAQIAVPSLTPMKLYDYKKSLIAKKSQVLASFKDQSSRPPSSSPSKAGNPIEVERVDDTNSLNSPMRPPSTGGGRTPLSAAVAIPDTIIEDSNGFPQKPYYSSKRLQIPGKFNSSLDEEDDGDNEVSKIESIRENNRKMSGSSMLSLVSLNDRRLGSVKNSGGAVAEIEVVEDVVDDILDFDLDNVSIRSVHAGGRRRGSGGGSRKVSAGAAAGRISVSPFEQESKFIAKRSPSGRGSSALKKKIS